MQIQATDMPKFHVNQYLHLSRIDSGIDSLKAEVSGHKKAFWCLPMHLYAAEVAEDLSAPSAFASYAVGVKPTPPSEAGLGLGSPACATQEGAGRGGEGPTKINYQCCNLKH